MKLYGVMYQDYSGDAGSGIDEKLFVSVDKASHEARDSAYVNMRGALVRAVPIEIVRIQLTNDPNEV